MEPLKIIVFGPTGGVGLELCKLGLARGHQVTAFARTPAKLALSHDRLIAQSATDWVIVRPTGLADGPARGDVAVVENQPVPTNRIARADVAAFMLDQLDAATYLKRTPGISWKK